MLFQVFSLGESKEEGKLVNSSGPRYQVSVRGRPSVYEINSKLINRYFIFGKCQMLG